jgi:hypothetical protein
MHNVGHTKCLRYRTGSFGASLSTITGWHVVKVHQHLNVLFKFPTQLWLGPSPRVVVVAEDLRIIPR